MLPQTRQDASFRKEIFVTLSFGKRLCGLALLLILAACSGHVPQPLDKLGEMSREDFISSMRWKQFNLAAVFMQPEYRQDFMETFTPLKDLNITDVRLVDLRMIEQDRRFETTIEMDYYLLPSVSVKTFSFNQTWVYFEGQQQTSPGFLIVTSFPSFP